MTSLVDNMIDQMLGFSTSSHRTEEDQDKYTLKIAAWGYEKDDLDISIEGDFLVVRGKKETEGKFNAGLCNKYRLPRGIKRKAISAKIENGILQIELPKGNDTREIKILVE